MKVSCLDLRALFARTYKITHDPAYAAEYGTKSRVVDPWLDLVDCRYGNIGPWGGTKLVASTHRLGRVATALRRLPCCEIVQEADDGVAVVFDLSDFPAIAKIIKPYRKRRLSAVDRQKVGQRLANVRPQTLQQA